MPVEYGEYYSRGTPVEVFAVQARRATGMSMSDGHYQAHMDAMSARMADAVSEGLEANKSTILLSATWAVGQALKLIWSFLLGIGTFFKYALVAIVLAYLAKLTIEEIAELIVQYKTRSANGNPFPTGVVSPK